MAQLIEIRQITVDAHKLVARVHLSKDAPIMTNEDIEGTSRIYYLLPQIVNHMCLGDSSASFKDVMGHTELAHLLEHVTVELLAKTNIAGDISCGKTSSVKGVPNTWDLEFNCPDDVLVCSALASAVWMLEWAYTGGGDPQPDIDATVGGIVGLVEGLPAAVPQQVDSAAVLVDTAEFERLQQEVLAGQMESAATDGAQSALAGQAQQATTDGAQDSRTGIQADSEAEDSLETQRGDAATTKGKSAATVNSADKESASAAAIESKDATADADAATEDTTADAVVSAEDSSTDDNIGKVKADDVKLADEAAAVPADDKAAGAKTGDSGTAAPADANAEVADVATPADIGDADAAASGDADNRHQNIPAPHTVR